MANATSIAIPRWTAVLVGALAFALYFATCSPTVNFTDSGELIAVAWTGGIAHPPGYPLYTLLTSAAIRLPFGDPAWRMNLVSVLFGAVAVGLFYGLVAETLAGMPSHLRSTGVHPDRPATPATTRGKSRRTPTGAAPSTSGRAAQQGKARATATLVAPERARATGREAAPTEEDITVWAAAAGGVAAAGLLALSVTFWNWATQAKFYSLHFAFVAGLLWLTVRAHRALAAVASSGSTAASAPRLSPAAWPPTVRRLHMLAFVIGLALTNHFLTFLLLPGIAVLLITPLRYARANLRVALRHAGTLLLAVLLPLLLYLYLPIRAAADPLIEWGTPDTWGDFWRHVTASNYSGLFASSELSSRVTDAIIYAANQFGPWLGALLLVPVGLGLAYLWRSDRGLLAATVVLALTHIAVVLSYSIREIVTYYVPLYMVVLWSAGLGVGSAVAWLRQRFSLSGRVWRSPAVAIALGVALPLAALAVNWGAAGHRDNYTGELFVRNALKNFRQDAVVLTNYWDLTSTALYLQHVLGERPDVAVVDKSVLRNPFYLDYLERAHPDLVSKNAQAFGEYRALLREWIDTGRAPQRLQDAYLNVLNGFIDASAGERPVYFMFVAGANDAQERQEINALLQNRPGKFVPDGLAYRLAMDASDERGQDPQFDLRGVTTNRVPLDEIEAATIALYGPSLQSIAAYLQDSPRPEDKDLAARLLTQAQELQRFSGLEDARPRLK